MSGTFEFLSGAVMMGCVIAALFFFRFVKKTRDRLFLVFGIAFVIFGLEQVLILVDGAQYAEKRPLVYLLRLVGFGLILVEIILRNRGRLFFR